MQSAFVLRVRDRDIVVNTPSRAALFEAVRERFRRGAGFAIATLNLDHLVKLGRNGAFREAYARQDIVVADGNPIVWLSRLAGRPVDLLPGSDLVEPLAELAARERVPVALLGATEATLARAAAELTARNPGLRIVACLAPSRGFNPHGREAGELIAALGRSGARLTFLALGAPRQEMFAARCRMALPQMGLVSVGAGLDFIAESQRRAPPWMRRLALEWLWRMVTDPRRLAGRYARCAMTLPGLVLRVATGPQPVPAGPRPGETETARPEKLPRVQAS